MVAIEHENFATYFHSEVQKLLSVRCPLKVGITYTYSATKQRNNQLQRIENTIWKNWSEARKTIGEDARTEYLFLVGTEVHEEGKVIA